MEVEWRNDSGSKLINRVHGVNSYSKVIFIHVWFNITIWHYICSHISASERIDIFGINTIKAQSMSKIATSLYRFCDICDLCSGLLHYKMSVLWKLFELQENKLVYLCRVLHIWQHILKLNKNEQKMEQIISVIAFIVLIGVTGCKMAKIITWLHKVCWYFSTLL